MLTDPTTWPDSPAPAEIRAARQAVGLTQRQAGALIYVSDETWRSWESGRNPLMPALWELWQMRAADTGWLARVR